MSSYLGNAVILTGSGLLLRLAACPGKARGPVVAGR